MAELQRDWFFVPLAAGSWQGAECVTSCVTQLSAMAAGADTIERVRRTVLVAADVAGTEAPRARVFTSVLCDLVNQGWQLRAGDDGLLLRQPASQSDDISVEKARVRAALLLERDGQLREPATRTFVRGMEARRLGPNGWTSVFSLMRDGAELAGTLRAAAGLPLVEREVAVRSIIDPYIQVIGPTDRCQFTGLKLTDVWRYFRHTWASPYNSTPGRKIWILVRDRAAENHPVMGIAALGSAIVQLRLRDEWIGWSAASFVRRVTADPSAIWARWLIDSLKKLVGSVFCGDFVAERLIRPSELRHPTQRAIARLRREALEARGVHRLYPTAAAHKAAGLGSRRVDWRSEARSPLFRSKRAQFLAELLQARKDLCEAGLLKPSRAALEGVLNTSRGRRAISTVLRHTRAAHQGVDMLDIIVCGAVPPYGALLGGKLVSLLVASPEVACAYEERYGSSASIIASSMAGRAVRRKPKLVLLGTTSLFGIGSSQYNRIRVPSELAGGAPGGFLQYEELGKTEGFGSFHFSRESIGEMKVMLARSKGGRRVNSIFGEGVNPRLRMVREALDLVGLPSDLVLRHGSPRIVYGIPLATNFRDILLGRTTRARFILPRSAPRATMGALIQHWVRRWLLGRIESAKVIEEVGSHVLTNPVHHGARICLPYVQEEAPLFPVHGTSVDTQNRPYIDS